MFFKESYSGNPYEESDEERALRQTWADRMRENGYEITTEEADKLVESGAGQVFHLPGSHGFFRPDNPNSGIVVWTDFGVFFRGVEDLVKGGDEVFVSFTEIVKDAKLPDFKDVLHGYEL